MDGKRPVNEDRAVLDASLIGALLRAEPPHPSIADALKDRALHAPGFLLVETSNYLWKMVRYDGLPVDEAAVRQTRLFALDIAFHPDADLLEAALGYGIRLAHPVYDCLYLALAVELDCAVLTADRRFASAAAKAPDLAARVRVLAA